MKYVLGHQNPDTDTYCSAVVYAQFLRDTGHEATAIALGEPNMETKFVFENANVDFPTIKTSLPAGSELVLVDHNEAAQSISERDSYQVVSVIDHHKIADFSTPAPVQMRCEVVGCTATILHEIFQEKGYTPSREMALLMLSAIISDTLYFRSPTTTDRDREAVAVLSGLAGCEDAEAYSLEMFAAKSDLGDMGAEAIVTADYKIFTFGETKVGIGVMETTHPAYAMQRKQELLEAMEIVKEKTGLDAILFCVVDILQEENTCLVLESDKEMIKGVFGCDIVENQGSLGNVLSRKKQIVPAFEKYFG